MIRLDQVTKDFGRYKALNGLTFSVNSGEFFGFLGPNGAGKTTAIKILSTLQRPTSGKAYINGHDVVTDALEVRKAIGMVFQDPSLDDRLTARENLQLHGMLYQMPSHIIKHRVDQLMELVGLEERQNEIVRNYSGGMKRRLEISRALMHEPKVIFLDEPTVGLDPQTRNYIWDYIDEIRTNEGVTIFLTTHYIEEAETCDRIGVLDHGKIIALDSPQNLKDEIADNTIIIRSEHPHSEVAQIIRNNFGLKTEVILDRVQVYIDQFDTSLIPQLSEVIPQITAIYFQNPTLEDVFLKLTGRTIREEKGGQGDAFRAIRRARSIRGR